MRLTSQLTPATLLDPAPAPIMNPPGTPTSAASSPRSYVWTASGDREGGGGGGGGVEEEEKEGVDDTDNPMRLNSPVIKFPPHKLSL